MAPVPEHDGGDGVDCKEEPDDKGIAVEEDFAIFQYGSEGRHWDRKLHKACDEPGYPVHCIIQAHHFHHLWKNKLQRQPWHYSWTLSEVCDTSLFEKKVQSILSPLSVFAPSLLRCAGSSWLLSRPRIWPYTEASCAR